MSINVSGIYMFSGWLGILGAIAGIVLPIIQATRKFAIIPAGVCILAAIVGFIQASSYGGTSSSYGGATASGGVSIGWGLIVFAVFAVAYLVISIITFQDKSQNPE